MPRTFNRRVSLALSAVSAIAVTGVMAASQAHAASAPANGVLAYSFGWTWQEVNPDGSGQHQVVPSGPATVGKNVLPTSPQFSFDGKKVAFRNDQDLAIWVSDADGTNAHPVVQNAQHPAWSADGSALYFIRDFQVWTVKADGTGATRILASLPLQGNIMSLQTSASGLMAVGTDYQPQGGTFIVDPVAQTLKGTITGTDHAAVSPDGQHVAAVATIQPSGSSGYVSGLYEFDITGANPVLLNPANWNINLKAPTWSPDGTQLVFVGNETGSAAGGMALTAATPGATPHLIPNTTQKPEDEAASWLNGPLYTAPPDPAPVVPPIASIPAGTHAAVRLGGQDRILSAIATADFAFGDGRPKAAVAVIARSDGYADALAGNALAAQKRGPLLLTGSDSLDPRVAQELGRVLPQGSVVYVLGGTSAVSKHTEDQLRAAGYVVNRIGGMNRFQTATGIARAISSQPHTVMVATGTNFPDALAAGAAAAQDPAGGVVVLTSDSAMPAETAEYLRALNPATTAVYSVGGQATSAMAAIPALSGHYTPLRGADRYATTLAVASNKTLFPHPATVGLATGANYPDALAGGAFVGLMHGPILLSDGGSVPAGELGWLHGQGTGIGTLAVFGGPAAVPDSALKAAANAIWSPGDWRMWP
ncbi:cell wall-binding repeat-containing protein [Catenulispora subtropica]|uniref:Cell wall binding repeat 2-containing protein n=1 Tax=Catenulispora subtropica TaxID=450798 RepID=A0ABP5CVN1_9ACTN